MGRLKKGEEYTHSVLCFFFLPLVSIETMTYYHTYVCPIHCGDPEDLDGDDVRMHLPMQIPMRSIIQTRLVTGATLLWYYVLVSLSLNVCRSIFMKQRY